MMKYNWYFDMERTVIHYEVWHFKNFVKCPSQAGGVIQNEARKLGS